MSFTIMTEKKTENQQTVVSEREMDIPFTEAENPPRYQVSK